MNRSFIALCSLGILALCVCGVPGEDHHKRANLVPPTQELEILDPRVDPQGRPAAKVKLNEIGNGLYVDIPETVIVHKYYYTGERTFQGPFINGGPVVLVFQHPRKAERLYVKAVLPAGAPEIHYDAKGIEYRYPGQRMKVSIGIFGHAQLSYQTGKTVTDRVHETSQHITKTSGELVNRTGIPEAARKAGETSKDVGLNVLDKTSDLAKGVALPVVNAIQYMPLVKPLTSKAESYAERTREMGVRKATEYSKKAEETVKTIR